MFIENYQYEEEKQPVFDCPDGPHEVQIQNYELKSSKKNNKRMIDLTLKVAGGTTLYHEFFVESDYFAQNISRVFDAFDIPLGDFNDKDWIGKKGVAIFGHREETFIDRQNQQRTVNKCYLIKFQALIQKQEQNLKSLNNPQQQTLGFTNNNQYGYNNNQYR